MKKNYKIYLPAFLAFCFACNFIFSQGLTLPYSSGYDNATQKAGWAQYRKGFLSSFSWNYGGGGFSPSTCLSHDYNVGGNPGDTVIDWFVSPAFNFTANGTLSLKVKTGGFSTPFVDNCEVWFGTNSQNPSSGNFVLIGNLSYMQPQYQWLDTTINLPFVTDSGYIAFKYKTIGAAWMTYQLDNINITLPASINENTKTNSLAIFPNPSHASTTISFPKKMNNAQISVYDLGGKKNRSITNITGDKIILDRENLSAGIYFIQLTENGGLIGTGKWVVGD